MGDFLLLRRADGRVLVVLFGLVTPAPMIYLAFTTQSIATFYIASFLANMLSASALGAAAASSQSLVLPRMRGVATATFFLSTTLIGLGIGPFMAGYVSAVNDGDLGAGVVSTLVFVPIGIALLLAAIRLVPRATANVISRAKAAGEVLEA